MRRLDLVYGGASVGLMGAVADATLAAGGRVIGVMPGHLVEREVHHQGLTELHVVDSMHTRKATMASLADAFVALPGSVGTYEELFEAITWAQLGLHDSPSGLVNLAGFYDGLLAQLDTAVREGFLRTEHRADLVVDEDPARLLDRLAATTVTRVPKWV